jgi:hypothetical protein
MTWLPIKQLAGVRPSAQENGVTHKNKVRGTVRKIGIEGGVYALITEDGKQIELIDPPPALQKNGAKATVELDRTNADVTIGMIGDAARVKSYLIE